MNSRKATGIFICILGMGLIAGAFMLRATVNQSAELNKKRLTWPTVRATVTKLEVRPTPTIRGSSGYLPVVFYDYDVDSQSYQGSSAIASGSQEIARAEKDMKVSGLSVGDRIQIHFDPLQHGPGKMNTVAGISGERHGSYSYYQAAPANTDEIWNRLFYAIIILGGGFGLTGIYVLTTRPKQP